jgi:HPt (histidine-containing phosphotransfer) domain-containing protein
LAPGEQSDFLFSTLADDPDLGELADEFADEMPNKIDAILSAHRKGNLELLTRLVHQLKGSAGSYGFSIITPVAARLEASLVSAAEHPFVLNRLEELANVCNRVRSKVKYRMSASESVDKASAR